jgi:hypothetical protein
VNHWYIVVVGGLASAAHISRSAAAKYRRALIAEGLDEPQEELAV